MYTYHKTLTKLALAILVALGPLALPAKAGVAWCDKRIADCTKYQSPEAQVPDVIRNWARERLAKVPNAEALIAAQDETIPAVDPLKSVVGQRRQTIEQKNNLIDYVQTTYDTAKMYGYDLPPYDRKVCMVLVTHELSERHTTPELDPVHYYSGLIGCFKGAAVLENTVRLKHFQP